MIMCGEAQKALCLCKTSCTNAKVMIFFYTSKYSPVFLTADCSFNFHDLITY